MRVNETEELELLTPTWHIPDCNQRNVWSIKMLRSFLSTNCMRFYRTSAMEQRGFLFPDLFRFSTSATSSSVENCPLTTNISCLIASSPQSTSSKPPTTTGRRDGFTYIVHIHIIVLAWQKYALNTITVNLSATWHATCSTTVNIEQNNPLLLADETDSPI